MKDKNNYNYYYKKRNIVTQWENAPGKEVILNFVKSLLKKGLIKRNATVLDVGCGTGYFLRRLRDECCKEFTLIGIDIMLPGSYKDEAEVAAQGEKEPVTKEAKVVEKVVIEEVPAKSQQAASEIKEEIEEDWIK